MENCLKNYDSEYHYLFYKISDFIKNGDSQEDYYIIGNIGRRFLEIFLNFKIPSSETIYTKCNNLKKRDEVDTIKVDKVLKLVNDYSHNENLDGLIKHADKQEGREVIQSLLQVVESIDKEHYDLLQKAVV
jgi:wobble nucleotide-excising tRNase